MARAEENASGPDNVESLNNEWLEYFVKENITGVHFGVITIRRSDKRKHWMRFDELPETHGDCGAAIERDFQLQDFLEKHLAEHDLLSLPMLSAPDIEISTELVSGPSVPSLVEESKDAAGEAQGSGKGGRKSAGSWLQAIAKAMGEVLGQKAGEMVKLSDKISSLAQEGKGLEGDAKADNAADMTAAQTELQGVSQEYKLLTETISTVLKGIGEALSTMGRKQ